MIGYTFRDPQMLLTAMCHSSYANEHRQKQMHDNERLEFLGDAVLEIASSDFLFHQYPQMPEGKLTKLRASIVCEPTLALCAREIHLEQHLHRGAETGLGDGGRQTENFLIQVVQLTLLGHHQHGTGLGQRLVQTLRRAVLKFVAANHNADIRPGNQPLDLACAVDGGRSCDAAGFQHIANALAICNIFKSNNDFFH